MNTFSVDTLRVDIFKELINLDQEKLSEVYKYVKELASKGNSETLILKEMLLRPIMRLKPISAVNFILPKR